MSLIACITPPFYLLMVKIQSPYALYRKQGWGCTDGFLCNGMHTAALPVLPYLCLYVQRSHSLLLPHTTLPAAFNPAMPCFIVAIPARIICQHHFFHSSALRIRFHTISRMPFARVQRAQRHTVRNSALRSHLPAYAHPHYVPHCRTTSRLMCCLPSPALPACLPALRPSLRCRIAMRALLDDHSCHHCHCRTACAPASVFTTPPFYVTHTPHAAPFLYYARRAHTLPYAATAVRCCITPRAERAARRRARATLTPCARHHAPRRGFRAAGYRAWTDGSVQFFTARYWRGTVEGLEDHLLKLLTPPACTPPSPFPFPLPGWLICTLI